MGVYKKQRKDGTHAWFYDFSHNDVRYRGVGGSTKTQALRVLEKKRSEVLNDTHGFVKKARNPNLKEFIKVFLDRRKHMRSYKRDILSTNNHLRIFGNRKLMSIATADIEDYIIKRLSEGVSNATINRELACLKRMYNLAIRWGDANRNPVAEVDFLKEPPGRDRFLSVEEAQKLIACSPEHIQPIIVTALNTGMRLMEILTLKWDQVHIKNVTDPNIEIRHTKNNRKRFVPINDTMVSLLESLMDNGSEYVFLSARRKGQPLLSVKKPFLRAVELAGINNFKFHDLRHTFASHYVMNGGDLMSLKEILGHQSMKMVERYSHLADAYKRRQVNNLNGKFTI